VIRPFLTYPDRRLRTPATAVGTVTDEHRAIWDEMIETMEAMPGVGLAAPQIGVMLRLAVVDASAERGRAVRLADPVIVAASDDMREHEEASPNIPGVSARLKRPMRVTVRFLDETGSAVSRDFEGLWATSVQHQVDHLNGRVFIDHLSPLKRRMALKRAAKRP
jgi:peptide deformylase